MCLDACYFILQLSVKLHGLGRCSGGSSRYVRLQITDVEYIVQCGKTSAEVQSVRGRPYPLEDDERSNPARVKLARSRQSQVLGGEEDAVANVELDLMMVSVVVPLLVLLSSNQVPLSFLHQSLDLFCNLVRANMRSCTSNNINRQTRQFSKCP